MEYAQPRLKTCDRMRRTFSRYLSHLVDRPALSITRADVEALRTDLAATVSPKTANSVIELVSTVYNRADEGGLIDRYNPARGLGKLAVELRERTLEGHELTKFFDALSLLPSELIRDFLLLLLFTGEQKSTVLAMRWEQLDLDRGLWFIPQRKRQPRMVYLLPEAGAILIRRQSSAVSPWVFHSECAHQNCSGQCQLSYSGHLEGPDKSWARLLERSGITDLRLNDLRNSQKNLEPVRRAYAQHCNAPVRLTARQMAAAQREDTRRKRQSQLDRQIKGQAREAIANPAERLELSPSRKSDVPTFGNLFRYYMKNHGDRCRTAEKMHFYFEHYIKCFADRPADQITVADVNSLHKFIGKHFGEATANRVLEILKAVFNKAIKWELIDFRNPAVPVSCFKLNSRDRFYRVDEIESLRRAANRHRNGTFSAYFRTCLSTAAREGNIRAMRWQDINWEAKLWRIPMTKNGKPHTVPLTVEALAAIESQKGKDATWVFPGRTKEGYMAYPGNSWRRLCKAAGIDDARIHDLRRTAGSWMAMTGASLPIIGKSLGHSNPRSTQIYARLDVEPVREAMEKAARAMSGEKVSRTEPVMDNDQIALLAEALVKRMKGETA